MDGRWRVIVLLKRSPRELRGGCLCLILKLTCSARPFTSCPRKCTQHLRHEHTKFQSVSKRRSVSCLPFFQARFCNQWNRFEAAQYTPYRRSSNSSDTLSGRRLRINRNRWTGVSRTEGHVPCRTFCNVQCVDRHAVEEQTPIVQDTLVGKRKFKFDTVWTLATFVLKVFYHFDSRSSIRHSLLLLNWKLWCLYILLIL